MYEMLHGEGERGKPNGGEGGWGRANYSSTHASSGGAGNPGGGFYKSGGALGVQGSNGTGGLMIIYGNRIGNYGLIASDGTLAAVATIGSAWGASGGSSGAGSVNIFYNNVCENNGNITANGGEGADLAGGAGGNGSITIGNISTGTFVKDVDESEN